MAPCTYPTLPVGAPEVAGVIAPFIVKGVYGDVSALPSDVAALTGEVEGDRGIIS